MPQNTHQRHDPLLLPSLKCPRCDSSNTKFCYYNNYSLSQPRHFCKACKRYWTRGGTLRNVPVGGGCRKNKRVRRQRTPAATAAAETTAHHNISPSQNYSLSTNPIRHNFPHSTFNSARAFSSDNRGSDLEHQMNGFGIGGSDDFLHDEYKIGFMADSASSFFSPPGYNNNYHSHCFGSSSPFSNSTTVMATLLASGIPQQKLFGTDEIGSVQHANHHPPDPSLIWFD